MHWRFRLLASLHVQAAVVAAGVVGLTAAALGAAEVLLTDLPHHVQHISGNIKVMLAQDTVLCFKLFQFVPAMPQQ
jgi:predicted nicotinamide N-methyase